jgi:predicted metal-dependent phosphoesterase TrpH
VSKTDLTDHSGGRVDLHVHTTASDGLFSPAEVVEQAHTAGLRAVAVTDHDTTAGLAEAARRGDELGVEVVPGVELTAYVGLTELHILGLFVGTEGGSGSARVDTLRTARRDRMLGMIERLRRQGVRVDADEVMAESGEGAVGRPHLARVLVRRGYVPDESEAFIQYLRPECPAYVKKIELSPEEAIALVIEMGGLAVYAHPGVSRLDERLGEFKRAGLAGIEVWHPKHGDADTAHYARLAAKRGLLPSGGSDFHGPGRSAAPLGFPAVPAAALEDLRALHAGVAGSS